jgi:hypothetical protein
MPFNPKEDGLKNKGLSSWKRWRSAMKKCIMNMFVNHDKLAKTERVKVL